MDKIDLTRILIVLIIILTLGARGIAYSRFRSMKNVITIPLPYLTWIVFVVWYGLMSIFVIWPSSLCNPILFPDSVNLVLENVGIVMLVFGEALFLWSMYNLANFYSIDLAIKEGHSIINKGPYRFIRHPMYTSYIISYIGFATMSRNILILLFFPIFVFAFWKTASIEERAFEEYLAEEFLEYKQEVGMFIPKLNKREE